MESMCRTCMRSRSRLRPLFGDDLCFKIELLTSIQIFKDTRRFPSNICEECVDDINRFYNFRIIVINNDADFRDRFHILKLATNPSKNVTYENTSISNENLIEPSTNFTEINDDQNTIQEGIKLFKSSDTDFQSCDNLNYEVFIKNEEVEEESDTVVDDQEMTDEELDGNEEIEEESDTVVEDREMTDEELDENEATKEENVAENEQNAYSFTIRECEKSNEAFDTENEIVNEENISKPEIVENKQDISSTVTECGENNENEITNEENTTTTTKQDIGQNKQNTSSTITECEENRTPLKNKIYKCKRCQLILKNFAELDRHRKDIHRKYTICSFCGKSVATSNLHHHIQVHNTTPANCRVCGKLFKNKLGVQRHMLYHKKEDVVCEICGSYFPSRRQHKVHLRFHVLQKKKIKCTICEKEISHGSIQRHMRVHTGERPYVCQYCGKGFSSSNARKTHIRQHTHEKPYLCEFCPMRFPQRVSLRTHLRSKHFKSDKTKDEG